MQVSTPGRICLFGEHQDYLGLPVIAMAISLRAKIDGKKRKDRKVVIHKPDLGVTEYFSLDDLIYSKPRVYFKSGINVCQRGSLFHLDLNVKSLVKFPSVPVPVARLPSW